VSEGGAIAFERSPSDEGEHDVSDRTNVFLPPPARRPAGAYSPAIIANGFVFASGQVPRDPDTGEMAEADIAVQTRAVVRNLERALEAAGASLSDVVSITAYLADIGDWDAFDAAYRAAMPEPWPTRTTLGAQLHGCLVEISAIALAP
jgi:2-iminobutanoate/2-iminopropanoate deaminase